MQLAPEGVMKKSFKSLIVVAVLAVIVSSVLGVGKSVKQWEVSSAERDFTEIGLELGKTVNDQSAANVAGSVEAIITEYLKKEGVNSAEVSVSVNISDDSRIYIKEVAIVCGSKDILKCREVVEKLSVDAVISER